MLALVTYDRLVHKSLLFFFFPVVTIQFRMQGITVLEGDNATLTVEKIGTTTLETSALLVTKNSSAGAAYV